MKKFIITEEEKKRILETYKNAILNEQSVSDVDNKWSSYIKENLNSLIMMKLTDYLDKAVEDAKQELSRMGGKFPAQNSPPPTEQDWKDAKFNVIKNL